MPIRRNVPWTEDDFAILERMLANKDRIPQIARVLQRSQIDVAGKVFAIKQCASSDGR